MEEITVSDGRARSAFITYLYNAVAADRSADSEILFSEDRAALRLRSEGGLPPALLGRLTEKIAEVIGVGYKYSFLFSRLKTCLPRREKRFLCAALIAADREGDFAYIRRYVEAASEICVDGVYTFRLEALRKKWLRILEYIPAAFSSADLCKFCEFLVGESDRKIYVRGNAVFGENFAPLRRSRLTGTEDVETEIMLSDAGFVFCLGDVGEDVEKFLQKYYAERAIFS